MPEFDIKLYDREFFEWHKFHVHDSSMRCMDWYVDKYNPKTVIDIGCGVGSYLKSAQLAGVKVVGYEISEYAKEFTSQTLLPFIEYRDCTEPIECGKFDLVISFETAEHIEPSGTDQFILNLVNATGKTLLFTAAPPGQEGTGHINCRHKHEWQAEFIKYLNYDSEKTAEIAKAWEVLGAPWYIVKNLLVFNR